jgi:hypothetical protein
LKTIGSLAIETKGKPAIGAIAAVVPALDKKPLLVTLLLRRSVSKSLE